ncbi:hypothetical protein DENSPDRAFT_552788 [Dentipellis sp. KUC8613]|nr:hypothetical protein DENSPDRAFT_552788 [Dentipellis sp. KUC8613]
MRVRNNHVGPCLGPIASRSYSWSWMPVADDASHRPCSRPVRPGRVREARSTASSPSIEQRASTVCYALRRSLSLRKYIPSLDCSEECPEHYSCTRSCLLAKAGLSDLCSPYIIAYALTTATATGTNMNARTSSTPTPTLAAPPIAPPTAPPIQNTALRASRPRSHRSRQRCRTPVPPRSRSPRSRTNSPDPTLPVPNARLDPKASSTIAAQLNLESSITIHEC